jgi:hypothetical protein
MSFAQRLPFDAFFSFQFCSNSGAVRRAPSTQDGFHRTRYCLRGLPRPCFVSLSLMISPSQLCCGNCNTPPPRPIRRKWSTKSIVRNCSLLRSACKEGVTQALAWPAFDSNLSATMFAVNGFKGESSYLPGRQDHSGTNGLLWACSLFVVTGRNEHSWNVLFRLQIFYQDV